MQALSANRKANTVFSHTIWRYISALIDLSIAGILFYAAAAHLQNLFRLFETIIAYKLLPLSVTAVVSQLIPFVEIALGCGLVHRESRPYFRKIALVLLATFLIAQLSVVIRGIEVDCGCFGGLINRNVGWSSIGLDVGLIGCILVSELINRICVLREMIDRGRSKLRLCLGIILLASLCPQKAVLGDEILDIIPAKSRIVVRVNNVEAFADAADTILGQLLDLKQLENVLTQEPNRVLSPDSYTKLQRLARTAMEVTEHIDSITVFELNGDEGSSDLVCVIRQNAKFSNALRQLLEDAQDVQATIDEDSREKGAHSDVDEDSTPAHPVQPLLKEWRFKEIKDFIIIASDDVLIQRVQDRIANVKKVDSSLIGDRRFERVSRALEFETSDAFIYVDPGWILPWLLPSHGPLEIAENALEEIVAGGIRLDAIAENENRSLRIDGCLKFTFPVQGLTENWDSYQPIIKIPCVTFSPTCLRIVNRDNRKYHETMGIAYDKVHGQGEYLKLMNKDWSHVGGFNIARDSSNGQQMELWFLVSDGRKQYLRFVDIADPNASELYQRNLRKFMGDDKPSFPYEQEYVNGSPGWFLSEITMRKKHENDFGAKASKISHAFNKGVLLTPNWSIEGDKCVIQHFLRQSAPDDADAATELERVFPGAKDLFVDLKPHFVELKWPVEQRGQFFSSRTMKYLRGKLKDEAEVRKVAFALMRKELESIPIESRDDRLFVASELLVDTWIKNYGRLATGVGRSDDGLRFRLQAFAESAESEISSIDGYDNYQGSKVPERK